ncbi:helix-turn-helix transcriptional regulator [Pseudomonas sp. dw_358]|uniref:AraC family transcriptional regulator n=1 Tax=Pseudomonas sp. dw_358 TaxID=2720083 RepID=UPI001BD49CCF|nr:helix-turn-helix transcriptional regulator [Pseudomonas sp. dw_358]
MYALKEDYGHGEVVGSHCHSEGQLVHATCGVMQVRTELGDWVIPTGHALWVPAYVAHEIHMNGSVNMRTLLAPPGSQLALPDRCQVIEIGTLLRELIVAVTQTTHEQDAEREHLLVALINIELGAARQVDALIPLPADSRLRAFCEQQIEAPGVELTLEKCGLQLHMSPRTFARLFQREIGMSFTEWRTRARMILSQQCLARGAAIWEVALEHGYQSPSAFAATFKRTLGYTPRYYQLNATAPDSARPMGA